MCSKPGDGTSRLSTLLFVLLCWSLAAEREYKGLQSMLVPQMDGRSSLPLQLANLKKCVSICLRKTSFVQYGSQFSDHRPGGLGP